MVSLFLEKEKLKAKCSFRLIKSSLVDTLDRKLLGGCDPLGLLGALCTVISHAYSGDLGGQRQQIHPSSRFKLGGMSNTL